MHICMYIYIYIYIYSYYILVISPYHGFIYCMYIYIYSTFINAQSNPDPFFIDLIIQNPHSSWVDSYPNAQA